MKAIKGLLRRRGEGGLVVLGLASNERGRGCDVTGAGSYNYDSVLYVASTSELFESSVWSLTVVPNGYLHGYCPTTVVPNGYLHGRYCSKLDLHGCSVPTNKPNTQVP